MPRATTWMSHSTWSAGSGALSTELAHSHMVAGSFSRSSGALSRATVDKGTNNTTEALANKSYTPCRGGVPPLTREQNLVCPRRQTGNCRRKLTTLSGASGLAISGTPLLSFKRLVNLRRLKAIIRTSASVGAMRRSLSRPRRSRDCMRTTSSWPPRLTAYSLARPRRERVLVVLQLAPLFRCLTQIKVNVQPVCDVLLVASQRHSLRSKSGEKS